MRRIIAFLLLFVVVAYGVWPYYSLYRLDGALAASDPSALAPFVDLPAIQASYKARVGESVKEMTPQASGEGERLMAWLAQGVQQLGDAALEQIITLDWVREHLRDAASRATTERPAYFLAGVERAFFGSWNRFDVRLGPPETATHVVMSLRGLNWRVTDIRE